jgi:hypothetical protein
LVQVSEDGVEWSQRVLAYERPFWLYGVIYDPASKLFWCPPHAIDRQGVVGRQIHLVSSEDGIHWKHVSLVAKFDNASEAALHFEDDRTAVVVIRQKYGKACTVAVAKPPYQQWELSERPVIAEGHWFFTIGGRTFLASRANYTGDDPKIKATPDIFDGRRSYAMIYRWTKDRQLQPWAVLDSMGDCSYPRLVETPTEVLCAYYSQHEDRVCKPYLCAFDKAEFLKEK